MKKLILNYTFDASARTITFKDYKSINLSGILSIKNLTRNVVIYILNTSLNGRTVDNRFIYDGFYPDFRDSDKLQIWYVDNIPDEVPEPPVGSIFAGTSNATLGQIIFSNTNGVSFGVNGQVITASVAPAGGLVNFSAGTTSRSLTNIVFSNANGVSFGLDGSTITASVGAGGAAGTISAGTTDVALGKVIFSNSNGVSFGLNGSTLTAQHNALTSQSNQALSGSNGSFTFQTATFGNLNGLSFYTSNGSIVGSYTVPSTAGHISRINVSAGTTSNNLTNFVLSNSNGVTFGLDGSTITASYSQSTHSHSSLVFSNDNNVTFGIAGSTLTASASYSNVTDYLSIGESTNFLLTNATSDFQFTSQMSDYQLTADMTNYQTTGNYLTTAMESNYGSNFIYSSASLDLTNISVTLGSDTIALSVAAQSNQPVAASASNGSFNFSTLKFVESNGVTWATSTDGIRASVKTDYLTTAMASNRGSDFVQATAAFAGTNASGTIASNGISVSVNAQSVVPQNVSLYALGNTTQNSSTVLSVNALSFNAIGSLTVGYSNGSIQLSAPNALTSQTVQTQSNIQGIIASDTTYRTGDVSLRDGNGISWASTTGQRISITHDLQYTSNTSAITSNALNTSASRVINIIVATNNTGGGTASLSSNISFSNANNMTFYTSAGNAIVGSFSQSNDTLKAGTGFTSAGNNIGLSGTLNTNGLSLSATVAAQSNQNISLYALGNTTQNSSTILNASNLSFNGIGSITVGYSNGSIQLSAANALTTAMASNRGSDFVQATAAFAGTNASGTIASNGISVSVSNQSNQTIGVYGSSQTTGSASSGTHDARSLSFIGAGIISIGNHSTSAGGTTTGIVISATQSNQAFSAANASSTFQTLSLQDSNGISFSNNGGGVRLTHDLQFTSATSAITSNAVNTSDARIRAIAASNATYTSGSVTFRDLNGITWQSTTGQQIQITHDLQYTSATSAITSAALHTSASRVMNIIAATNSTGGGTASLSSNVSFSNANNFTFYTSAGNAVVASFNNTNLAGTGFTSAGANISLSGTLNSAGLLLSASVAAPGAAAENNNINLLGANTAGNTTASGSTIGWSGINVTLSGTNASQVVISAAAQTNQTIGMYATGNTTQNSSTTFDARTLGTINGLGALTAGFSNGSIQLSAPATSSISGTGKVSISVNGSTISIGVPNASTLSGYNPYPDLPIVAGQVGQGTLQFEPEIFPNFQCDRILLPMHNTNSSNSSGSHTLSFWVGVYTRNASSLSLYTSVSASTALTHSGTAGSYSLYSGIRHFTIGMTNTFTEGEYWLGFLSRTTSGGTNGSYSNMLITNVNSAFQGFFGSSNNTTQQFTLGQGVYTATTSAMPASVAFSQIRGSDSGAHRAPMMLFASSTV